MQIEQDDALCGFSVKELCLGNIRCKNENCNFLHPRRLAGLCLQYLKENRCLNQNECKMLHFKFQSILLKKALLKKQINGFCFFNLCEEIECKDKKNCAFLHPNWKFKYCIKCIKDQECQNHDTEILIDWDQLSEKVYELYNIGELNPEKICDKSDCQCKLNHNTNLLNSKFCIQYFKGNCPFLKCSKTHLTWEEYKNNKNFNISYETELYPCNQYGQKKQLELQQIVKEAEQKQKDFKLKQQIKSECIIDVVFIMDCTGTMDKWIVSCKNQINEAAQQFMSENKIYQIRLAFIGYRDYEDEEKLIKLDFTDKFDEFTNRLKKIKAYGGDDEAEDVLSGLNEALKLNFADNPKSILITCLFADAPCHGKQYHDENVNDDYEEGVDQGSLEQLITQYKQIKINNFFFCIDIDKSTEKMYSIMQRVWPAIQIRKKLQPQDFHLLFKDSLTQSLSWVLNTKLKQNYKKAKIRQTMDLEVYFFEKKQLKIKFWNDFNLYVDKYQRIFDSEIHIQELKEEFEGSSSNIFFLYDFKNCVRYVTKIEKKIVQAFEQRRQITEEELNQHQNDIYAKFYNQVKAQLLAKIYREKTAKIVGAPPIFYVNPVLIQLIDADFYGLKELYAETYINLPDVQWIKYSNNLGYQDLNHYYMSSFSHFTLEESCGLYVLTDLQGKNNILTDPAFHHQEELEIYDRAGSQSFRDSTDFSQLGIGYFKNIQHQECSFICESLGYQSYSENQNQSKRKQLWKPIDKNKIPAICLSCNKILVITLQQYQDGYYKDCEYCKNLKQQFKTPIQCICCKDIFQQPIIQQLANNSQMCYGCSEICQEKISPNDKNCCFYCELRCKQKLSEIQSQFICQQGLRYLRTLRCKKCCSYNTSLQIIDKNEYIEGTFLCQNCQN